MRAQQQKKSHAASQPSSIYINTNPGSTSFLCVPAMHISVAQEKKMRRPRRRTMPLARLVYRPKSRCVTPMKIKEEELICGTASSSGYPCSGRRRLTSLMTWRPRKSGGRWGPGWEPSCGWIRTSSGSQTQGAREPRSRGGSGWGSRSGQAFSWFLLCWFVLCDEKLVGDERYAAVLSTALYAWSCCVV